MTWPRPFTVMLSSICWPSLPSRTASIVPPLLGSPGSSKVSFHSLLGRLNAFVVLTYRTLGSVGSHAMSSGRANSVMPLVWRSVSSWAPVFCDGSSRATSENVLLWTKPARSFGIPLTLMPYRVPPVRPAFSAGLPVERFIP
jgi:hypothetical protein